MKGLLQARGQLRWAPADTRAARWSVSKGKPTPLIIAGDQRGGHLDPRPPLAPPPGKELALRPGQTWAVYFAFRLLRVFSFPSSALFFLFRFIFLLVPFLYSRVYVPGAARAASMLES